VMTRKERYLYESRCSDCVTCRIDVQGPLTPVKLSGLLSGSLNPCISIKYTHTGSQSSSHCLVQSITG
jgi:hypothetical protein